MVYTGGMRKVGDRVILVEDLPKRSVLSESFSGKRATIIRVHPPIFAGDRYYDIKMDEREVVQAGAAESDFERFITYDIIWL